MEIVMEKPILQPRKEPFVGNCEKHKTWSNKYENKCPECHKEQVAQRKQEQDEILNRDKIDAIIRNVDIPERYKHVTFENYQPEHPNQKQALETCNRYVTNIDKSILNGMGMVFLGNSGLGKTHLAFSLVKELAKKLFTAKYIKHYELVKMYRHSGENFFNEMCKENILIIDEVGLGDTEFTKDVAYQIIDKRYDKKRPTILISNLNKKEFAERCSNALQSRLAECGYIVTFDGDDYRLKDKKQ